MKECKKHGIVEHVLVTQFRPRIDALRKTLFVACCTMCRRAYSAKHRAKYPWKLKTDSIRAKDRLRHLRDRDKRLAQRKVWYAQNKVLAKERMGIWREANKEYVQACSAAYYRAHKTEASVYKRVWKRRNPEKVKAGQERYERSHPEECRQRHRLSEYKRRARKRGLSDGSVARCWRSKVRAYDSRCAYCGKLGRVEQDHVIPVSRGGAHTIKNVAPCCRSCNSRKRTQIWSPRPWAAALPLGVK